MPPVIAVRLGRIVKVEMLVFVIGEVEVIAEMVALQPANESLAHKL